MDKGRKNQGEGMSAQPEIVEQTFTAGKEIVDRIKAWGSGWMTSLHRFGPRHPSRPHTNIAVTSRHM
jgi:hypothetical protein